jgi:hypothetical protein
VRFYELAVRLRRDKDPSSGHYLHSRFVCQDHCGRFYVGFEPMPIASHKVGMATGSCYAQMTDVECVEVRVAERDSVKFDSKEDPWNSTNPSPSKTFCLWFMAC